MKQDYEVLMEFGIEGLNKEVARRMCSDIGLHNLIEKFEEDKHLLFMNLLDYDIHRSVIEKLIAFIGMNLEELRNNKNMEVVYGKSESCLLQ
jgi:hypothetical protein